jgi:ABC-type multidrug transport system ATPase subunit
LREFAREGRIVIAATHDLRLVQACDSVLILRNGHVDRKSPKDFLEDQRAAHIRLAATQEGTT